MDFEMDFDTKTEQCPKDMELPMSNMESQYSVFDGFSEIEKVGDILSFQLFSKHNIYRLIVTRVECTIYLTRDAFIWRRNFENNGWVDPTDPTREEMSDNRPPPPPPINSHSPLIHRRGYRRSNVSSPIRSSNGGFSSRN